MKRAQVDALIIKPTTSDPVRAFMAEQRPVVLPPLPSLIVDHDNLRGSVIALMEAYAYEAVALNTQLARAADYNDLALRYGKLQKAFENAAPIEYREAIRLLAQLASAQVITQAEPPPA